MLQNGLPEVVTKQSVFDKVATHLLQQGRPAAVNGTCRYRTKSKDAEPGEPVLACAVGCLISDERYTRSIEGAGVTAKEVNSLLPGLEHMQDLLVDLQIVHDATAGWTDYYGSAFNMPIIKGMLKNVASRHGLTMPDVLDDVSNAKE